MGLADLNKTTFGNDPRSGMETPDVYDENALSEFINNGLPAGLEKIKSVIPAGVSPTNFLRESNSSETKEMLASMDVPLSGALKTAARLMPPGIPLNELLDKKNLPRILNELPIISEMTDSSKWNMMDSVFLDGTMDSFKAISDSLGIDCPVCQSACGRNAGAAGEGDAIVNDVMGAALTMEDLKNLILCGLVNEALGFFNTVSGGAISNGAISRVAAMASEIAAYKGYYDLAKEFIEKAADFFSSKDRKKVTRAVIDGYTIDRNLGIGQYETEAIRVANILTEIDPNWWFSDISRGRTMTTKNISDAPVDISKILAFHPDYWSIGISQRAFDPLTKPWKELVLQDFPILRL